MSACPKCGADGHIEKAEVDIGVGVQEHIIGFSCSQCGQIAVCNGCGAWDHQPCSSWCLSLGDPPVEL